MLVLLSSVVSAQERPQTSAVLAPRDSTETYVDRVPVSSLGIRVGIMTASTDPVTVPSTVSVNRPVGSAATLCVAVTSRDGRYRADYAYDLRGTTNGVIRVSTPTRYPRELRKYRQEELAILASVGPACDAPATAYLVASWSGAATTEFAVLLNSRVPTTLIIGRGNVIDRTIPCTALSGVRTAFNLRCVIRTEWLTPASQLFIRQRSGESIKQIPVPLALP
ncbi:hypothetical protein [Gemmatimonas sp.]|uniref:hypothetical protein n=1 Tax=Gemmatimonas sp. TaxID=1962908 RepID=UPI0033409C45